MTLRKQTSDELATQVNVIILKSGDKVLGTVGTVGDVPAEGEDFSFRTVEMTVPEALSLALGRAGTSEVAVDLDPEIEWDDEWGDLNDQ